MIVVKYFPQAVIYHAVNHLGVEHSGTPPGFRHVIGYGAHVFRTAGKDDLWRWETRIRAFENEVYLVMVNHAAPRIDGGSLLIDPLGDLKLLAGPEEEVFYGTIDPARIAEVREQIPDDNFSLEHRNPEAYGPLE